METSVANFKALYAWILYYWCSTSYYSFMNTLYVLVATAQHSIRLTITNIAVGKSKLMLNSLSLKSYLAAICYWLSRDSPIDNKDIRADGSALHFP
jgi:hypothetical protein